MSNIHKLALHPDSHAGEARTIAVEVARPRSGRLMLRYALTGATDTIALPPSASPSRADGLWRHTCFEAFACEAGSAAYREFNFAPSRQWAAYAFDDYRAGMRDARGGTPRIEVRSSAERFELEASFAPDLADGATWLLGLSAVVEERDGGKSWWALRHPPGKPDFHHPDCFVVEVPPPTGS
jgi:hypothetical protein